MEKRPALPFGQWDGDVLRLAVRVHTRSKRLEIGPAENGRLKLRLTAPPVDGKANAQARKLLADSFGVAVSCVTLVTGKNSRDKQFTINGPRCIPEETLA